MFPVVKSGLYLVINARISVTEKEGVIQYQLDFTAGPSPDFEQINELNAWRRILYLLHLIGQDPDRYEGFGFGNISCRYQTKEKQKNTAEFIISGSQTGHLPYLGNEHYAIVTEFEPLQNKICATGAIKPSSEALTHGAVYKASADISAVFHAHCPEIWNHAEQLGISATNKYVSYGTPAMAEEIENLMSEPAVINTGILIMAGHTDGVLTFGNTAQEAGNTLVDYYSRALQIQDH